ncbi:MAG: (2Fe-2S)-binding protein [gamma proteobacterium symbiont of Bathyaustriella thionipta]|nr:(2Fe-2S)-binding protein [gamma proteobacterium symbiont of Bathyaustriella thionipta]
MFVCVCNSVTDSDIREAANNGACSMQDLQDELKVASCCGRCSDCARRVLHESLSQRAPAFTLAGSAASAGI